ncbi:beta-lactamase-like protein, partial [Zopfochytrium polystomum]
QCPWYKRMPETSFTVDAFSYGSIPGCTAYFLSHFHSDHYGGLTSKFVHGPIFCSKVTANLVKKQLGVDPQYLFPLPLNETVTVQGVQVTLIDANHCPGAVLFLFEIFSPDRSTMRYLHTGDFRVHPILHLKNPLLPNPTSADGTLNPPLDIIFLDTTYCNPSHAFPPQDQVIETITELAFEVSHAKNPRTLVVVGTYLIGKERVFKSIARALRSKVYVDAAKARILACLEDEELNQMLTRDPLSAGVHHLKGKLDSVSSRYDHILAVRPTGWTFRGGSKGGDTEFSLLSLSINQLSSSISVVGVPYSEHSSFAELAMFVGSIAAKKVIPTVNV